MIVLCKTMIEMLHQKRRPCSKLGTHPMRYAAQENKHSLSKTQRRGMVAITVSNILLFYVFLLTTGNVFAHGLVPVQTGIRLIQPVSVGSGFNIKVGNILTFVVSSTPVPNGATQGAGNYITVYVPANTEVVGVRLTDRNGTTLKPDRGPLMPDGWGPRGANNLFPANGLTQGSISQVYADTGIFYSTDLRTMRNPNDADLTLSNGIQMNPAPTGAGLVGSVLGTLPPYYAHNQWDLDQANAFGVALSPVGNGKGNTPFGFGSPVAGPFSHYAFEKVNTPACSDGVVPDYPAPGCASVLDNDVTATSDAPLGPWKRIQYTGSEIGTGAAAVSAGTPARVGAADNSGWQLSSDNPLPATTNAVRFSTGETTVGKEVSAEISLRVLALPLEPSANANVICAETFGGDAAEPQNGLDNAWRYFVPSPACAHLDTNINLTVDKPNAVSGDQIVYTLEGKNLSLNPQTNVVVKDTFNSAEVSFVGMVQGPPPAVGPAGTLTWPSIATRAPGERFIWKWAMLVTGSLGSTTNRTTYTSDTHLQPGISDVAITTIEPVVVLHQTAVASPLFATAGSIIRYTATLQNTGSGTAVPGVSSFVRFTLPNGFSFCAPPAAGCAVPTINGTAVANPVIQGNTITFSSGLQTVPTGGIESLVFDVSTNPTVVPGRYVIDMQSQYDDPGVGRSVERGSFGLAPLLVDIVQSQPPVIDVPLLDGATTVTGVSLEASGSAVTVYVNGNASGTTTVGAGGIFSAVVPTLFAGQHVYATVQAPGEVVSEASTDVIVSALPIVPTIALGLNGTAPFAFNSTTNKTMTLAATTVASNPPVNADIYVALQLPDGTLLVMQPGGGFGTTLTPLLSNVPIPDFNGPIFNFTFTGTEPAGNYTWFAALTTPNTLNVIGTLATATFSFAP